MGAYRLYTVVPFLVKFIDNLTNIYVSGGLQLGALLFASMCRVMQGPWDARPFCQCSLSRGAPRT